MRHLWLALKEGFIEHRRALLTLIGVLAIVLAVIHGIFFFASKSSALCASCHIMKPYVEMAQGSIHKDLACVQCHKEYRFILSKVYVKYALGIYIPRLRAEVPDNRCLSCHEKQNLDTDKPFLKNIHFSHKNHLTEMRRGKSLHCSSCHTGHEVMGNVSAAQHTDVDKTVCFTCHFKGAEGGKAVTGCLVCHGPPKTVVTHQGFQFDHGTYLQRGVRCDTCHTEVVRGNAAVPRERCRSCHVSRVEAYEDTERLHKVHIQHHEINCALCHDSIEHGKVRMAAALTERCDTCHKPTHTPQEQMYIGIGGQGVADTPSTMFLARVACDSCHAERGSDPRKGAEALRKSCVACHGKGYDRMVEDWIREVGALVTEVSAVVQRAESAVRSQGKGATEQLAQARHNLEFIKLARGEHNIHYTTELLRAARNDATTVLQKAGSSVPPPPAVLSSTSGYCRVCHSTSHLGTRLPFSGLEYDHNRHLASGLTCDRCHSLDKHGKTEITIEGCMGCHHGKEQNRTCESCHPAQASLYKGSLAGTSIKGEVDVMAKADVSCDGCHDLASKQPLVKGVQQACVTCHEKGFDDMLIEWINTDQGHVQELAVQIAKAETQVSHEAGAIAATHKQEMAKATAIYHALVKAKGAHNSSLSSDAYDQAKNLLAWVKP